LWTDTVSTEAPRASLERAHDDGDFQGLGNGHAFFMKYEYARGNDAEALRWGRELLANPIAWYNEIGLTGRIAARLGDLALANSALVALGAAPQGAVRADSATLRAVIAAANGEAEVSLAEFQSALSAYRELGLKLDLALGGLTMLEVLPTSNAVVDEAGREAEEIASELGATRIIARIQNARAARSAMLGAGPVPATPPGDRKLPIRN
jgi:hypothetical protein